MRKPEYLATALTVLLSTSLQACGDDKQNTSTASPDGGTTPTSTADGSTTTEPMTTTSVSDGGTRNSESETTSEDAVGVTVEQTNASTDSVDGGSVDDTGEALTTSAPAESTTEPNTNGDVYPTADTSSETIGSTTPDVGVTPVGEITISEATGQEVSLELPDEVDTTTIVVLLIPTDASEEERPVPSVVADGEVVFRADEAGTYVVHSVGLKVPAGCNGDTWAGNLNAASNLDVDQLAGYSHLQGTLTISSNVTDLEPLRCLTEITGNLDVTSATKLASLELPNLVHLRGRLYVYNAAELTTMSLPELVLAKGVSFNSLPELTTLSLPHLINTGGGLTLSAIGATAEDPLEVDFGWLVSIPGDLSVNTVTHLEDLDGFRALQEVTNSIDIRTNGDLSDGHGLASLESVGSGVTIYNNASLESISLSSLRDVTGSGGTSLSIQSLPELVELDVSALRETPGGVYLYTLGATSSDDLNVDLSSLEIIRGNLDVQGVSNIVDLDGFSALTEVTGAIDIRTNASLESAAGLASLQTTGNTIVIYNNAVLEEISLAALEEIGGQNGTSLNIQALPELTSLNVGALEETPGGVYLYQLGSTASDDLAMSFDSLDTIRGNLDVQGAVNLLTLDGFSNLREVTGAVDVRTNESLASAAGFAALETVGRSLIIYNNPALTEISLASLEDVGANSSDALNIQSLPELMTLDVGSLLETPGQIYLHTLSSTANSNLSLDFASLEVVRSTVTVQYVSKLTTVDAFDALEEVSGHLVVYGNADLVSLSGFDTLTTLEGNLDVRANPLLSECQPLALRNRLQTEGFDGTATISGNLADTCD